MSDTRLPPPPRNPSPATAIFAAILLTLSWFAMIYGAAWLNPAIVPAGEDTWTKLGIARLAIGVPLYLVLAPLLGKWLWGGRYLDWIGFNLSRQNWWLLVAFLFGTLALAAVMGVTQASLAEQYSQPLPALANLQPAIVEEVLFRGLIIHLLLRARLPLSAVVALSAALFAVPHIASLGWQGIVSGLMAIPLMIGSRLVTGTVIAPILMHILANAGFSIAGAIAGSIILAACWLYRVRRTEGRHAR